MIVSPTRWKGTVQMNTKNCATIAITTGLGLGYLPLAPGTWGSTGAILFAFFVYAVFPINLATGLLLALVSANTFVGVKRGRWVEQHFGATDPGEFVLDELAGQWLTCAIFFTLHPVSTGWIVTTFLSFRLFDVVKLPPIRSIEKLPHGWGMMLDDLAASVYAAAALCILFYFQPSLFGLA